MNEPETVIAPDLDAAGDHYLGSPDARHVLIEYGSYACAHCRDAQCVIDRVREHFAGDLVYAFRHKPLSSDEWAEPTAILAEGLAGAGRFFDAHALLMARPVNRREDLVAVADELGVETANLDAWLEDPVLRQRVADADAAARQAGVTTTPTFIVDGTHYDGPWDEMSLLEVLDRPVARQARRMMHVFAGWAPATGVLLAIASVLALVIANSPLREAYDGFLHTPVGLSLGAATVSMAIGHLINDALMALFFLVVGLEIKREVTIGTLSKPGAVAIPAVAAIGGMLLPAVLYVAFTWGTDGVTGWGIPMATDIAFTLGLLSLLGRRVPLQLKVFITALAIVDDMGAIVVIAVFYAHGIDWVGLAGMGVTFAALIALNRGGVYSPIPYALLGIVLWCFVYVSGVHATLAGILLALTVPTRPPPNLQALMAQAKATLEPEIERLGQLSDAYPAHDVLRTLDEVHDRLESPAHRLERTLEPWSSFLVLPLFALANAGVAIDVAGLAPTVVLGVVAGLAIGKPLGVYGAVWLATRLNIADWPAGISPGALLGAGALAGIGFTMSLFIAGEAFTAESLITSAKVAVLGASLIAAIVGLLLLHRSLPHIGERSNT